MCNALSEGRRDENADFGVRHTDSLTVVENKGKVQKVHRRNTDSSRVIYYSGSTHQSSEDSRVLQSSTTIDFPNNNPELSRKG